MLIAQTIETLAMTIMIKTEADKYSGEAMFSLGQKGLHKRTEKYIYVHICILITETLCNIAFIKKELQRIRGPIFLENYPTKFSLRMRSLTFVKVSKCFLLFAYFPDS